MRIGEFIKQVTTTKDTVRHYEELELIRPGWINGTREYSQKDTNDFQAIKEMQSLGLTLKEIQAIFEVKRDNGCGSIQLINDVLKSLDNELTIIYETEQELNRKKIKINEMMGSLQALSVVSEKD